MHPPDFSTKRRLSDWPHCRLVIKCPCLPRVVLLPVRLLIEQRGGDKTFDQILIALHCTACGERSASVYLVSGQTRQSNFGPPPSWAVELVAPPASDP